MLVSLWTRKRALDSRRASIALPSWARLGVVPYSAFTLTALPPASSTVSANLSLNSPKTGTMATSPFLMMFQTAASTPPVPDDEKSTTSPPVWKRLLAFSLNPRNSFPNSGPLWLMMGLVIAFMTLSETFVGPGSMISFCFSKLILLFTREVFLQELSHPLDSTKFLHVLC